MDIYKTKFKVNEKGNIAQLQARELKYQLQHETQKIVEEHFNIETLETSDGIVLLLPNEEEGIIPCTLTIKVKNLDYDYETARKEFIEKQEEKEKKKKEKEEKAK